MPGLLPFVVVENDKVRQMHALPAVSHVGDARCEVQKNHCLDMFMLVRGQSHFFPLVVPFFFFSFVRMGPAPVFSILVHVKLNSSLCQASAFNPKIL